MDEVGTRFTAEKQPIRVLLVEDDPTDADLLREALQEVTSVHLELTCVTQLSDALKSLGEERCDVVLLDLLLPDSKGIETFVKLYTQIPEVPIIVLAGLDNGRLAARAMQEGAQDFLIKGQIYGQWLGRSIRDAIARHRLLQKYMRPRKSQVQRPSPEGSGNSTRREEMQPLNDEAAAATSGTFEPAADNLTPATSDDPNGSET